MSIPDFILAQQVKNNILSVSFGGCGLHVLDRVEVTLFFSEALVSLQTFNIAEMIKAFNMQEHHFIITS